MSDYTVTVGDIPCPISAIAVNALSCEPNPEKPPESAFDIDGGSSVLVVSLRSLLPSINSIKNANNWHFPTLYVVVVYITTRSKIVKELS